MTGRARGRARGRENNTQNTRRPGEPVPVSYGNQEVDRAVGYGRNAIGSSHNPQGLTDEFPSLSLGNTRNQAENSGINTHVSGNDIVSGNNTGTWQGLPANGVTAAQRNEVGRGRAGNTNGGVQGNQVGLAVGGRAGNTNGGVQGSEVGLAVRGRAGNTNGGVQGSEVGLAVGGRAGNTNGGVQGSEVGLAVGGRAGNTNGGVQGSGVGLSVGVRAAESRTSSSGNGYSGGSGGPGMQSGHPGNARSRPIEQRSFPGRTNDEERSAAGQGAVQQLVTQSAQASLPPGFGLRKGFNTVGGVGQQIQLATNHFALTMRGDQDCLYQYSLEFSPDLEHKAKRMQAIRSIENTIGEVWLYDKGQMMFLPVQLPDEITCCQGSIRRRDTPEGVPVQVTITYRCDVLANSPSFGQVLNTIMARIQQTLGMKRIGDRYFYTEDPFVIPQHRIEILPGFRTSIQHHDNGYLLGLDVAHKYLRSETVVEFLHNLSQRMPNHDSYTDEATRQLCGEIVLTRYNNKTYKILEIDWDKNPLSTFTLRDGSEITFVDYYTRQYDRVLEVLDQPLLLAKPKGRTRPGQVTQVYLLPELCFMTGLSADMRSDFNLMRSISDYTRVAPKDRATELTRFMGDVNTNPEISGILGGLNIQIDQNLTHFSGRVLNPESIIQGRQTYRVNPTEGDWSREIRSSQMHTAMPLQNWAIVVTLRDSDAATDFLQTMLRVGPPMGVPVNQPHVERLQNDQINSYLMALRGLIREENPSMVVVIVPTNRKDRYDAIKKLCCIEMPGMGLQVKPREAWRGVKS